MKKIVIFASSYTIGSNMGGIGIRLWELAQVLSKYHRVQIVTDSPSDFKYNNIKFTIFNEEDWRGLVDNCDTIISTDMPDTRILMYAHAKNKQIITENAVPIEHLEYSSVVNSSSPDQTYEEIMARFKLQVLLTDHFISRSLIGKQTLITSIAMMGRLNYTNYNPAKDLKIILSYIPIGFNRESDAHAGNSWFSSEKSDYIWNGGIWNYFDANMIPKAVSKALKMNSDISVMFMYTPPENQYIPEYIMLKEAVDNLNLHQKIRFISEDIPHYERDGYLKNTKAIICIGKDTIENYTCHRLRLRDVFLYRKPIIIDKYGATAQLVREYGIGITVGNDEELVKALKTIKEDNNLYCSLVNNIEKIREQFVIENNIQNLLGFLNKGEKAPDITGNRKRHEILVNDLLKKYPSLMESPVNLI